MVTALRTSIGIISWLLSLGVLLLGGYILLSDGFGPPAKLSTGLFCLLTAYLLWSWGLSVFKVLQFEKRFIQEHGLEKFEEMKKNSPIYSRDAFNRVMKDKEG